MADPGMAATDHVVGASARCKERHAVARAGRGIGMTSDNADCEFWRLLDERFTQVPRAALAGLSRPTWSTRLLLPEGTPKPTGASKTASTAVPTSSSHDTSKPPHGRRFRTMQNFAKSNTSRRHAQGRPGRGKTLPQRHTKMPLGIFCASLGAKLITMESDCTWASSDPRAAASPPERNLSNS